MINIYTIIAGLALLIVCVLLLMSWRAGRKKERQKQIERENILLKEGVKNVEEIKAQQAANYTNDINAAHDRLHPFERD